MPARQRCAICQKAALSGARLCGPCRAALKRARDTTVSDSWLAGRRPRGARMARPARRPAVRPDATAAGAAPAAIPAPAVAATPGPDRPSGHHRPLAIAGAVLGAFAMAAIAIVHLRTEAGEGPAPRYAIAEGAQATDPIQASKLLPSPAPASQPEARLAPAEAPVARAGRVEAAVVGPVPAVRSKAPPVARSAPPPIASPPVPEVPPAPLAQVVPEAPPPPPAVVAVAPAAPARPPPDRWQRLADELARCPADLIARTVCQQSLRLEHCEGAWGRVAVCPPRVERDYGN